MSKIYKFHDHMMLLADYKNPELHKHLASHIIVSIGKEMTLQIDGKSVTCRGVCIDSNILHTGGMTEEGAIVFLFTETSRYAASIRKKFFKEASYMVLENNTVDRMLKGYFEYKSDKEKLDEVLLKECGADNTEAHEYDMRIVEILSFISEMKTIEHSVVDDLSKKIYLSKSRLSHLFREQTGMSLHSYLAYEKLRKTYQYFHGGKNITDACMLAGFDSPSHCAATCKRMFGISLRDVYKTVKDSN